MLLKRSELNDLLDYTNAAIQANKQAKYPQILWAGNNLNGFVPYSYPRKWSPDPSMPPHLNSLEMAEYTAAQQSNYHHPDTLDSRLISSRGASDSTVSALYPSP